VYEGNLARVTKLYDDVYFRSGNLEVRDQCNCAFIVLGSRVALVDYTGQDPDEELIDEAEKITGKRVRYILLTHAHVDHVAGFRTLKRKDISLIATRQGIAQVKADGYPVPPVEKAIDESQKLVLDGFEFSLERPSGVAHSPWDLLIGIPRYKLLFTGDMVVPQKYMYFHSSFITGWIEAIDALQQRDWTHLAMGHGFVCDRGYLQDAGQYLRLLSAAKGMLVSRSAPIDEKTVTRDSPHLYPELREVVNGLLETTDAKNVARQINQLAVRTAEGS
jgi:glyoxylase-like metal-dependent hydrolase (beta-lactamase superfamily II)